MRITYEIYKDRAGCINYVELEKNSEENYFETYGTILRLNEAEMAELVFNAISVSEKVQNKVREFTIKQINPNNL